MKVVPLRLDQVKQHFKKIEHFYRNRQTVFHLNFEEKKIATTLQLFPPLAAWSCQFTTELNKQIIIHQFMLQLSFYLNCFNWVLKKNRNHQGVETIK